MNISLDYDETYTRDPEFWNQFIQLAKTAGHKIYCITLRSPQQSQEVYESIGEVIGKDNCIFTSMITKKSFAWSKKIRIDVWIDDMPVMIEESTFKFGETL